MLNSLVTTPIRSARTHCFRGLYFPVKAFNTSWPTTPPRAAARGEKQPCDEKDNWHNKSSSRWSAYIAQKRKNKHSFMFYSHTFSLFDHIFSGSSWFDKWAALQLQFVDARLQTLLMSDQNIWFHGGGGVEKGKDADNKQRTCTPKVMKSILKWRVSLLDHSLFYKACLKSLHLQVNNKQLFRFSLGKMGRERFHQTAFNFMEISSNSFWRIHLCEFMSLSLTTGEPWAATLDN